jgi:hypothetical protein
VVEEIADKIHANQRAVQGSKGPEELMRSTEMIPRNKQESRTAITARREGWSVSLYGQPDRCIASQIHHKHKLKQCVHLMPVAGIVVSLMQRAIGAACQ